MHRFHEKTCIQIFLKIKLNSFTEKKVFFKCTRALNCFYYVFLWFIFIISRSESFLIERKPENGGNAKYEKFEELEEAFAKEEVHPGDLKNAVVIYLNRLLEPVRKKFETPELKKLTAQAYPDPNAKPVTKKGPPTAAPDVAVPSRLNIKVGKIVEVSKHPEAEALYIEKIDVGESEPRTIGEYYIIFHQNEIN